MAPALKYSNVVVLVTVIRVLVTLSSSEGDVEKLRTVTICPDLNPCAAAVVMIAVLPESRSNLAEVADVNATAVAVAVVVGRGRPRS